MTPTNFTAASLIATGLANWAHRISVQNWDQQLTHKPLWHHKRGLMQTSSGYGRKLATEYMVTFEGRQYRIYTTCYSNSGTSWFKTKKHGTIIVD